MTQQSEDKASVPERSPQTVEFKETSPLDLLELARNILTITVGAIAIVTASGFVIVNTYLSRYGKIHGYTVLPSQYLAAGVGLWLMAGCFGGVASLVISYTRSLESVNPKIAFALFAMGFPVRYIRDEDAGPAIQINRLTLVLIAASEVIGYMVNRVNGLLLVSFVWLFIFSMRWRYRYLLFILGYIVFGGALYGQVIYSSVPHYLGGGDPVPVYLVFREQKDIRNLGLEALPGLPNVSYKVLILAELIDGLLIYNDGDDAQPYTIIVKNTLISGLIDGEGQERLAALATPELAAEPIETPTAEATPP